MNLLEPSEWNRLYKTIDGNVNTTDQTLFYKHFEIPKQTWDHYRILHTCKTVSPTGRTLTRYSCRQIDS